MGTIIDRIVIKQGIPEAERLNAPPPKIEAMLHKKPNKYKEDYLEYYNDEEI